MTTAAAYFTRPAIATAIRVYRIRRCSARKGAPNVVHHADVVAPNWASAMKAAREGRVQNWRLVRSLDTSDTSYQFFKLVGSVEAARGVKADAPVAAATDVRYETRPRFEAQDGSSYLTSKRRVRAH